MKLRMILVFAFGFNIATPALGAAPGETYIGPNKTGELQMAHMDMRGAQCNRQQKKPLAIAAQSVERRDDSGRAGHGMGASRAN